MARITIEIPEGDLDSLIEFAKERDMTLDEVILYLKADFFERLYY